MNTLKQRRIEVLERADIPPQDWLLAFAPMAPLVLGAAGAWTLSNTLSPIALEATALWGSAILLFLAGVRRGLSFRTEGGPTFAQLAIMLLLYCLGFGALLCVWVDRIFFAFALLIAGYVALFIADPIAALRGEVPLHFRRLRRLQMPVAIISLSLCLAMARH